ncbi:MAG TPA: DUF1801 domain-containing protein [Candidatus Polarisedimenticolia bacterium]|nr:DUF1801 domain-containing protein [Candidatus Polarisedimenticolia bacterium]
MAEPKTRETKASVAAFLGKITDAERRKDCKAIAAMMRRATGAAPKMWGTAIVGFGSRPLKYASGRELDWPLVAFSPRKGDLTLYLGPPDAHADLLKGLGKHKTSKACLYIKRLADVDRKVLESLIRRSLQQPPAR